jgi:hypothetical protein
MTIYQDLAAGMHITNADLTEKLQVWINGYVDDTSIFTSIDKTNEVPTATTIVQATATNDASIWERLLSATGGKLELTKCFYYTPVEVWRWRRAITHVQTRPQRQQSKIEIQEICKDQPTEIKHLDWEVANLTLEVYKTITGNQSEQKMQTSQRSETISRAVNKKGRQKSETISRAVGAANFTRKQTKTAWNVIYIQWVTYSSVATYLEEKELVKIENKAIMVFLPKMGYNRTTARAVVCGPAEQGGIGIKSLYAEKSIAQITALIQHTRLYSPLGRTIRINLDWVQITAGIAKPVLKDTQPIQHMEGEWFKSLRVISPQDQLQGRNR